MTANKTAKIQFYEGTDEPIVPEIRLTRSKEKNNINIKYNRLYLKNILVYPRHCFTSNRPTNNSS